MVSGSGLSGSSLSSSTGAISFGGLASGIDTNLIVSQLIAIGKRPITAAQNRRDAVQSRMDTLKALNGVLATLLAKTAPLNNLATFGQRSTSVSAQTVDADKVSATATNGAALQNFTFEAVSLATQTTAASASALGAPVSAALPLDQAGFGTLFTAGTFSINGTAFTIAAATPTKIVSAGSVGATFDPTAKLNVSNLTLPATSGSFTINGTSINFDVAVDSLNDVIARIDASAAGVTAIYEAATQQLTLTNKSNGPALITLADAGGGNFLQAMNLINGVGTKIGTETAGTNLVSLNDVIAQINGAAIGVTASIVNDAAARPNLLQLTSASPVQLGSGADTSNFLAVTSLLESPAGTTRTSVKGLGQTQQTVNLQDARFATALGASSGSFTINGVAIVWDATADSLQNLITRINSSGAKVTATYDAFNDRLKLTANATGASAITLADVGSNFLAASGLLAATQTIGAGASYKIAGGPLRYSTSNTITDAVPGLTITATGVTTAPVTIAVNLATQGPLDTMTQFVQAYNSTTAAIRSVTKYDPTNGNGVLFGDPTTQRLETQLRSALTGFVSGLPAGLRSLSDVGLTFGAVGSVIGSTNDLALNTSKFMAALQADPEAVAKLFTTFVATAALDGGGTGSLASISGTPTGTKAGRYSVLSDALGNLEATFQANDGSPPMVTPGVITAGGTNTTLIPGLTLTAKAALVSGTDLITVSATQQGFGKTLHEYVNSLNRTGGLITNSTAELQQTITNMNAQIDRMTTRLNARQDQLVRKFTNMELAISRMQSQQQALTAMNNQLAAIAKQ